MKICFNQATGDHCKDHSMMADLELAEKYGFDYIDLRFDILDDYLKEHSVKELADWFATHNLKPSSYSALLFFNWKKTKEEEQAVYDEVNRLLPIFEKIGLQTICCVPSFNIKEHATIPEIIDDCAYMLNKIADLAEPYGIRIALEVIGHQAFTVNRWDVAVKIIEKVNRESVGLALDLFHFFAMGSDIKDLRESDGKRVINLHINGSENLPKGASYFDDTKRLWPGEGAIDNKAMIDALLESGFDKETVPAAIEVFRPEYYELSIEDNIKKSYETTKEFVERYLS